MAGLHAEIRTMFAQSAQNYIVASRVAQGKSDLEQSRPEERGDIEARWLAGHDEMKGFYSWRSKEKGKSRDASPSGRPQPGPAGASSESLPPGEPPKTGWKHTKNLSWEERKRIAEQKKDWKNRQTAAAAGLASGPHVEEDIPTARAEALEASHNPEFEQAIQAAVQETSRGDPAEDVRIERAIRSSVMEMRRRSTVALPSATTKQPTTQSSGSSHDASGIDTSAPSVHYGFPSELKQQTPFSPDDLENITDEEYQALMEQAVQLSIAEDHRQAIQMRDLEEDTEDDEDYGRAVQQSQVKHTPGGHDDEELRRVLEASEAEHATRASHGHDGQDDDDKELKEAIEASQFAHSQPSEHVDDEKEFKQALEASEKAHQEELARAKAEKSEEDIIMEYIKKQSLAEEQYRQKGKHTMSGVTDDDEELKRAIEESMKASGKVGESSGSGI